MDCNIVGSRIREIRCKKELSRAIVANCVGISEETLARYERDERPITIKTIGKIASALNCTVLELFYPESFHGLHNHPAEATAIFAETVDRLLKLCKSIDEPSEITEMVADLIYNGEANYDVTKQFVERLGDAVAKSILFLRQLSPNTPVATEALATIEREVMSCAA